MALRAPISWPSISRSRPGSGVAASPGGFSSTLRGRSSGRRARGSRACGRTSRQLERFEAAAEAVGAAGVRLPPRHVAASAGLLLDGVASLDGARPGLSVYGLLPDELFGAGSVRTKPAGTRLRPILSLHARP